jgi:hypothetical protein
LPSSSPRRRRLWLRVKEIKTRRATPNLSRWWQITAPKGGAAGLAELEFSPPSSVAFYYFRFDVTGLPRWDEPFMVMNLGAVILFFLSLGLFFGNHEIHEKILCIFVAEISLVF